MGMKLSWRQNVVQNFSRFSAMVVQTLVQQGQISQAKIANAAKAGHGADAHSSGRYISRTGILSQSIIPGRLTVTDKGVDFEVVAGVGYAGFVEGDPAMKRTDVGVYPFLRPAAEDELPYFIARLRQAIGGMKL